MRVLLCLNVSVVFIVVNINISKVEKMLVKPKIFVDVINRTASY